MVWRQTGAWYFYPRPPRGGRPALDHALAGAIQFLSTPSARRATIRRYCQKFLSADFYPRPPRGGRLEKHLNKKAHETFLSTPSARRATEAVRSAPWRCGISIHALREEGDHRRRATSSRPINFYPRPPRGGRRLAASPDFQPGTISIHALREEGDRTGIAARTSRTDFYPRPPRGGRPC